MGPLDDPRPAPIRLLAANGTTLEQLFVVNDFVLFHGSHVILGHNYTLALSAIDKTVVSLESKSLSVALRCFYIHLFVCQRNMQVAYKFEFGCVSVVGWLQPTFRCSKACDHLHPCQRPVIVFFFDGRHKWFDKFRYVHGVLVECDFY